ncbi:MAG: hypothetical protein J6V83_02125 [Clostridia bacterium]|nr:hypothetical protein [Clostridia bacterium]
MSVIPFKSDAKLSYSLALDKINNKDYGFAIRLLNEAINIEGKPEYYIELAELYFTLGEYNECACTYSRLARDKGYRLDVVLGILRAHCALREISFCSDYLNVNHAATWRIYNKFYDNQKLKKICLECKENTDALIAPHMVDVKDNAEKRILATAQEYYLKNEFGLALDALEKVAISGKYYVTALELKTLLYLKAGDYDNALKTGKDLASISKGNSRATGAILISLYYMAGESISTDFRNAYIDCEQDVFTNNKAKEVLRFLELTKVLGYFAGLNRVVKRAIKSFPCNSEILFFGIEHYLMEGDADQAKKLIAKALILYPNHPKSATYNYLINDKNFIAQSDNDTWLNFTYNDSVREAFAELKANEYLAAKDFESVALNKDLLTYILFSCSPQTIENVFGNTQLQSKQEFKDFLIWALDNAYLSTEIKYILLETLHNVCAGAGAIIFNESIDDVLNVMYFIPEKSLTKEDHKRNIISKVYARLVIDVNSNTDNVNKARLLNEYKYLIERNIPCEQNYFCAVLHYRYLTSQKEVKNNELLMESVSHLYNVSLTELYEILKIFEIL